MGRDESDIARAAGRDEKDRKKRGRPRGKYVMFAPKRMRTSILSRLAKAPHLPSLV
jgi:hypothetical protein